jgi:hypothetical protein
MTLPTDVADAAVIRAFTGIHALLDEMSALVARGWVASIETKVCKLDPLTGEYAFSRTPEDTRRTAAAIGGASVTIMEKLGHLPMNENPWAIPPHPRADPH